MSIFKQKKGLGRGISSLIGDTKNTSVKNKISISEIVRGKYQPRKIFNKERLDLCKKNCLIINTSRPEVLDYNYLYKLLKKNIDKRLSESLLTLII